MMSGHEGKGGLVLFRALRSFSTLPHLSVFVLGSPTLGSAMIPGV
jgi:hypothetical protein